MVSGLSDTGGGRQDARARRMPTAVKIVIAGGFGVGKTTMVGTVSETRPLRTEEILTDESVGIDDVSGVERKKTTTVAMDFGRLTFRDDYVLYLFGTPGQERFWFMWDEVSLGAATMVGELKDGAIREYEIHPEDFGLSMKSNRGLKVGDAVESKEMVLEALSNVEGTPREIVALNAGAALYAADVAKSIGEGIERARAAIASGAAKQKLEHFVAATRKLAPPAA